jgi:hypothetical protein
MEKVLYLVHTTRSDPKEWTELRAAKDIENQFPGVYLSIITEDNRKIEEIYPGDYIMYFSPNLLKQKNYHINIRDYNGFISEGNTYFPWNLDKAINKIKDYSKNPKASHSNEVVFHDNIPMKYCCQIVKKPAVNFNNPEFLDFVSLPDEPCVNKEEPDMTKLPFYVYSFEKRYTGVNPLPPSSNAFYRKIAQVAKLNPIPRSTNDILASLEEKAPYFLEHREEQDINVLKRSRRQTRKRKINCYAHTS